MKRRYFPHCSIEHYFENPQCGTMGRVIEWKDVENERRAWRQAGRTVVATNGCFDVLHVGHLRYLQSARALGDVLWVGLNDDAGVRELKGPSRPVFPQEERAELLAAWEIVGGVTIFPGKRATDFLRLVEPDIYVKGGDYTVATLDAEERTVLEKCGTRIEILQLVPGKSTTSTLKKMQA
jgi:rfaE bifunctional protein nucleotidyltransferase chain/domain